MNNEPKKGYGYIYKYTSPSGKSYIGQTICSLDKRAGKNGINYKKCTAFYKAIQKYGFENFEREILAEVPQNLLDEFEIKYIQIFNTYNNGYNSTIGGQYYDKEYKKVYQYSSLDGHFIKEWKNTKEIANFFNSTPQVFENVLNNRGYTQYGFCWSYLKMNKFPIHERIVNPEEKQVKQYDLQGNLIKIYKSISEAAKENGIERSPIKKCCRHELNTAYGFKWECSEILKEKKYNNTAKSIKKIDPKNNEVISVYPSISAAARSLNKDTSLIRRVLDKESNTAYGFKWKTA